VGAWHIPQLQLEMLCAGPRCRAALYVGLTALDGASVYRLERDDEYIADMLGWLSRFYSAFCASGAEGRSGGGLFDESGELIGVCYAADPELQEGLYNGAEVVYYQLAKLGLQRLFNERSGEQPNTNNLARDMAPNRTAPPTSELTVFLMGSDGKQEQLHITQPNPQLLQALRDSSRRQ
jgi:hypothetical protein